MNVKIEKHLRQTNTITLWVKIPDQSERGHIGNPAGYGPHPADCLGCQDMLANGTPWTLTPRSETYWAS